MRILIADDQRDVGRSLAELVRYCNHDVVAVVGSGLEAINAYSLHHPDLVLMDYRMPKLNGGTACRHIIAKDPAARIILVTAWSPSDDASASGAIAVLPKPIALDRLNATLQAVVQMLPAPSPAEMPFPEIAFQPDPIDYPISDFQSFLPAANSDLPAPIFELPTPSSELQALNLPPLPVDAIALVAEKKSRKPHRTPRRAQRARVR